MLHNINPLYLHRVFHGIRFKVNNEDWLSVRIAFFYARNSPSYVQSAKPPVHLFKTKRFYFEVLFQNEASLLEQNQTAFKWTSNPI